MILVLATFKYLKVRRVNDVSSDSFLGKERRKKHSFFRLKSNEKGYTAKKWSFLLNISSVTVTVETVDLVKFTEEILKEKFHFLCSGSTLS